LQLPIASNPSLPAISVGSALGARLSIALRRSRLVAPADTSVFGAADSRPSLRELLSELTLRSGGKTPHSVSKYPAPAKDYICPTSLCQTGWSNFCGIFPSQKKGGGGYVHFAQTSAPLDAIYPTSHSAMGDGGHRQGWVS